MKKINEKINEPNCIGLALAGHAKRAESKDALDNPLTDLINLIIAEIKAKEEINEKKQKH
jgi:hypothetical protein